MFFILTILSGLLICHHGYKFEKFWGAIPLGSYIVGEWLVLFISRETFFSRFFYGTGEFALLIIQAGFSLVLAYALYAKISNNKEAREMEIFKAYYEI